MVCVISIEGNIGSGKSTFVKNLQNHYSKKNIHFLKEPVVLWEAIKDSAGENIIECFYKDPLGPGGQHILGPGGIAPDAPPHGTHMCMINNFPLQRWVNLIVSLNNRTMDVYLNGKLVRTCILPAPANIDQYISCVKYNFWNDPLKKKRKSMLVKSFNKYIIRHNLE